MKTIYALLIGINDYPTPAHQLNGCINDRNAMDAFFKKYCALNGLDYKPVLLSDSEASRQNIINQFSHFDGLKDGDIGLLYYSGHGSQMFAPKEFWRDETDQRCETMVCHDSRTDKGRDLADKELSYLIWKYTHQKKVHFTAIFDCCHSGTITRGTDAVNRMAEVNPFSVTAQRFEGFSDYKRQGNYLVPPESNHIVLSASQSNESSLEVVLNGIKRGLFTHSLIATLEKSNLSNLTYAQLLSKVQTIVQNRTKVQNPQVIAQGNASVDQLFLDGSIQYNAHSIVKFSREKGWVLELGSLHGVNHNTTITIQNNNETHPLKIETIASGQTILKTEAWMKESDGSYRVQRIEGLFQPLELTVNSQLASSSDFDALQNIFTKENIQLISKLPAVPSQADYKNTKYIADLTADGYELRLSGNPRPLFTPIRPSPGHQSGEASPAMEVFLSNVQKVMKWESLSELSNPIANSQLVNALDIQMYSVHDHNNYESVNPGGETVLNPFDKPVFDYYYKNDEWENPALKLNVKNNSSLTIWVGALFMGEDFVLTDAFLPVKMIKPEEEAYEFTTVDPDGFRTSILPLFLPDELHSWGETEISNQIKIFASTEPFSLDAFRQEGVELFKKPTTRSTEEKGLGFQQSSKLKGNTNWTCKDIVFKINRPQEGKTFSAQHDLKVGNLTVQKHSAFSCDQVSLSSSQVITRSTTAPAPPNFGALGNFEPLNLANTRSVQNGLDTVEFHNVKNKELVNPDHPLNLSINIPLADNEHILPFGYDPDTQLYYPLGQPGLKPGSIQIQQLPDEVNVATRRLGKSLRIYLQKVVYKKILKTDFSYPILAVAQVQANENVNRVSDKNEVAKLVASPEVKKIIIFVHGIIGDTEDQVKVVRRAVKMHQGRQYDLTDVYDLVMGFDYESLNDSIETTARNLKKRLEEVGLGAGHGKTVHLVAHSMGGLVSRWFLEQENGDQYISHFIQIGSPNEGSPWAKSYDMGMFALTKMVNFLPIPGLVNSMLAYLGKARKQIETTVNQLQPNSEFSKRLNGPIGKSSIPYTIISGDSTLMPDRNPQEQKLLRKMLNRFNETYRDKLFKLFFHDRSDDIVAMASMQGIPSNKAITIDYADSVGCSHFTYFRTEAGVKMLSKILFELEEKTGVPS